MMRWAVDTRGIDIEADVKHDTNKRVPQTITASSKIEWLTFENQKPSKRYYTKIRGSVWIPSREELQQLHESRLLNPKMLQSPFGPHQQHISQSPIDPQYTASNSNPTSANSAYLNESQQASNNPEPLDRKEVVVFSNFLNSDDKRTAVTIVMDRPVFKGVDIVNTFLKHYVNVDECLSQRFSTNPRLYKLFFADELTGEEDMPVHLDLNAQNFSCYFINPLPAARLYLLPQRTGLLPSTPYDIDLTVHIRSLDQHGKNIQRKCIVPADMLAENLEKTISSRLLSSAIVQGSLRIKYGPLELNINEYYDFGAGCGRPTCPIAERTVLSLYRFGVTEVVVNGRAVEDIPTGTLVEATEHTVVAMDVDVAFSFQQFEVICINRYGARQQWLLCVDGEHLYTMKPNSDSVKTVERPIKDIEEVRVFPNRPRYIEISYTSSSRLEVDRFECSTASNCMFLDEKLRVIRRELRRRKEMETQTAVQEERYGFMNRLLSRWKIKWFGS